MNWTKGLVACGLALGLTVSLATPSDAARRDGLGGNGLIIDINDIYIFPQLTLDYVNFVRFELKAPDPSGASSTTNGEQAGNGDFPFAGHVGTSAQGGDPEGEALFIFGTKSFAMSISAHRSDYMGERNSAYGAAAGMPLLGQAGTPPRTVAEEPWSIVDLNFAFDLEDAKAGVRVAIGNSGTSWANDKTDATGHGNLVFVLGGGYSMTSDDLALDLGAHFALNAFGEVGGPDGGDSLYSGTSIYFKTSARGYFSMDDELSIGFLANISLNTYGLSDIEDNNADDDDPIASESKWSVDAAVGPVYNIKDKAQIAAYAGLRLEGTSLEPNDTQDEDTSQTMTIAIPHVNLAAEIWVYDWFAFRAGVGYAYKIETMQHDNLAGSDDHQEATHTGDLTWSAGVGFKVDDFTFDGALNNGWLTQGPNFLSGGDDAAFLTIAANYSF